MSDFDTITPRELEALHSEGRSIELIDVRSPAEFREIHVAYARNVPLGDLNPDGLDEDSVYVMCRTGNRAKTACERLKRAGRGEVINVEGGIDAWERAGLPVVRGRKALSLERQVRIAAGLLVLLGLGLGWSVHPYLIGITAFVGAGLVFAGITDFCGMGILLAKMPWNRTGNGATCTRS
jgi:rhodanese-related sulfurtransferase